MLQLGPVHITIRYDESFRPSGKGREVRKAQRFFDNSLQRLTSHVTDTVKFTLKVNGLGTKEFGRVISEYVIVDVLPYTTSASPASTLLIEVVVDDKECYREASSQLLTYITSSILSWLGCWSRLGNSLMVNLVFRPMCGMHVRFDGRTVNDYWGRDDALPTGSEVPPM